MAARTPLVLIGGDLKELPAGESLAGLGEIPIYVSAYQQSGAVLKLFLDFSFGLPVTLANGTSKLIVKGQNDG